MLIPEADPVRKVSIIPRGMALGVTFAAPAADRFSYDEGFLLGKIKVARRPLPRGSSTGTSPPAPRPTSSS
jgi:ATP-dependent Zn protease